MSESNPWVWYSDPDVLRRERERIFRSAWHYVGHAGRLSDEPSYFACETGGVPAVVTRDAGGELRAFLNVCRHRGAEIASGEGRRETLQCPYHAWTYGLDGRLGTAPRAAEDDLGEIALAPLRLEGWGPFLFVNADSDAPPLAVDVELPFDPAGLRFHERVHYSLAANWKIAVENYLSATTVRPRTRGSAGSWTSIRTRTGSRATARPGASTAGRETATGTASSTWSGRA